MKVLFPKLTKEGDEHWSCEKFECEVRDDDYIKCEKDLIDKVDFHYDFESLKTPYSKIKLYDKIIDEFIKCVDERKMPLFITEDTKLLNNHLASLTRKMNSMLCAVYDPKKEELIKLRKTLNQRSARYCFENKDLLVNALKADREKYVLLYREDNVKRCKAYYEKRCELLGTKKRENIPIEELADHIKELKKASYNKKCEELGIVKRVPKTAEQLREAKKLANQKYYAKIKQSRELKESKINEDTNIS